MVLQLVEPLFFSKGLDPLLPCGLVVTRIESCNATERTKEAKMLGDMLVLTKSVDEKIDVKVPSH